MKNKEKKIKIHQLAQNLNFEKDAINYYWQNQNTNNTNNKIDSNSQNYSMATKLPDSDIKINDDAQQASCSSCQTKEEKDQNIKLLLDKIIILRSQLSKLNQKL